MTAKQIARKVGSPITTVYSKIKRMEGLGIIKHYKAILDPKKLDKGTTAFLLISFAYRPVGREKPLSQREIAKHISVFPGVQEVHIITGDWDLLIKLRAESVESIGKFVVDNLRLIKGLEKTLTCMVFETVKETTKIHLPLKKADKH